MWFLRPSRRLEIRGILGEHVHPAWRAAHEDDLEALSKEFEASPFHLDPSPHTFLGRLTEFLIYAAKNQLDLLAHLKHFHASFVQRFARASSHVEQHRAILDYARVLGASERQLQGDRQALSRFLDRKAMDDRNRRRVGTAERRLVFILDQLGEIASRYLEESESSPEQVWDRLNLERLCLPLVDFTGDGRVRVAALGCLLLPIRKVPSFARSSLLSDEAVRRIYQLAQQPEADVWLQDKAIEIIREVDFRAYETILSARLRTDHGGDDLFFRRRAAGLLSKDIDRLPAFLKLAEIVAVDPSPFVRQGLIEILHQAPVECVQALFPSLLAGDEEPPVRALAWLGVPKLAEREGFFDVVRRSVYEALSGEGHDYVVRVALHVITETHRSLAASQASEWYQSLKPLVETLHLKSESLPVRRWAAQARERFWCQDDVRASHLAEALAEALKSVRPGRSRALARSHLPDTARDECLLGRVLSVLSQEDFGWDVSRRLRGRLRFTRGHRFGMRWWRVFHESRNPSPDKRQGFRHTIGRKFSGQLRVPSAILAEISPTKVPGEPLMIGDEAGWRPYLPLVDEALDALRHTSWRQPLRLYTSEGVTSLAPPRSLWKRLRAWWRVTRGFAELAAHRNWKESSGSSPETYIHRLRNMGFEVSFDGHHAGKKPDSEVTRFFDLTAGATLASALAMIGPESWDRLKEYFYSVYGNNLLELGVFLGLITAVFLGRHLHANRRFNRARQRIPMVLGGWGTRGKSGTERIKAALINAMGYPLVSKTTGCEAMFLYSDSYGETEELFLFRPYDKATIWEQLNIVGLASEMKSKVFLWECMGLTPSYVAILQRQWMRDDVSTIVNTYPDHEDLQGPAGVNIPEVMTNFLTEGGKVLTSEQHMTPILKDAAKHFGTELKEVNWIAPGLLTPDLIERFPYDEHPNNIALVMAMGEELGVPPDFAVKEMADRVVPDLGVLKTFPVALVNGRRLQFINGMSANERFGCLANWRRLQFDRHDPYAEPGEWLSTVVNNRADRISRSKVFASILVQDLSADCHFLIGSNLKGLLGYIREAWDAYTAKLTLASDDAEVTSRDLFERATRKLRQPVTPEDVKNRLRAMLEGLSPENPVTMSAVESWESEQSLEACLDEDPDWKTHKVAILQRLAEESESLAAYEVFSERLSGDVDSAVEQECWDLLWQWFERKLHVVEDYHATGDTVIQHVAGSTPPGFRNRIMGLQNIKGTGLDFVYRWQAWDKCHLACDRLLDDDFVVAQEALHQLAALDDHGVLGSVHVRQCLKAASKREVITADESGTNRKELQGILTRLDQSAEGSPIDLDACGVQEAKWYHPLRELLHGALESFLDAGDAVRRRKRANRVYRDLADERISIARAAKEIQILNKRQKGGWFGKPELNS